MRQETKSAWFQSPESLLPTLLKAPLQMFHVAVWFLVIAQEPFAFFMTQQLILTGRTSPDKTQICKFLQLIKSALWPLLAGSNIPVPSQTTGKFLYQSLLTYNNHMRENNTNFYPLLQTLTDQSCPRWDQVNKCSCQSSGPTASLPRSSVRMRWGKKSGQSSSDLPGDRLYPFPQPR